MKVKLKFTQTSKVKQSIAVVCPHCGYKGTFMEVGTNDIYTYHVEDIGHNKIDNYLGIRKCPNEKCNGHLFFISDNKYNVLFTSPSMRISFDPDGIPQRVLDSFQEAVICHSNSCYIASAIMIRKTLEEICHDREANGKNLFEKLENLAENIFIPKELSYGMHNLRLLGNDAAHIESQTFSEVGKEEVELSLEFTKEILKAVYQYKTLIEKFEQLKKRNEDVN